MAKAVPLVIETETEFERADAEIGRLLQKGYDKLSVEEQRPLALLSRLIEDYENRTFPAPTSPPHQMLQFLMEQNDLRQADLVEIFGSRGRVSEVVNGRRAISKIQAKALGGIFQSVAGVVHLNFSWLRQDLRWRERIRPALELLEAGGRVVGVDIKPPERHSNVLGAAVVLESIRLSESVKHAVFVTTDKVYTAVFS